MDTERQESHDTWPQKGKRVMTCYNGHRNEGESWHLQIATGSQENHGTSCDITMATERHESHGMLQWTQKGRRDMTHGHRRARES